MSLHCVMSLGGSDSEEAELLRDGMEDSVDWHKLSQEDQDALGNLSANLYKVTKLFKEHIAKGKELEV